MLNGLKPALAGLMLFALPVSAKTFVISSFWSIPTVQVYEDIVAAMYCAAGFEVKFQRFPMARALQEAKIGNTDGDLARYTLIEAKMTNLIPVPEPLPSMEVVYLALPNFKENTVTDETSTLYRVGYFQGLSVFESAAWNPRSVSVSGSYEQLLALLVAGRIDIALVGSWDKELLLKQYPALKEVGKMTLSLPVHHYLNRRHYRDIKVLDTALKQLKSSLDLEPLVARALQKHYQEPSDRSLQTRHINCADIQITLKP